MKKKFPQIFKILLLFCFISMNAQTINYDPPGFYVRGQPISTLVPNQSGITIQGGTYRDVSLFAGTGSSGGTNTSSSSSSSFQNPRGIVKDRSGNYYVSEVQGKRIRKISATRVVTTVHQFTDFEPRDLVINSNNGDLYAVIHTHRIIRIPNTNWANYPLQEPTYVYTSDAVNVIAGSVSSGYTDAAGTAARFNNPWGLAIASDNTYLLVSDFGNNRIRKVMLSNFAVSTFVPSTTFSGPTDVHIVTDNLMYVAEYGADRIRKIEGGASVTVFASGTFSGVNFDGTGATGFIDEPHSLTADGMGNVYVVERLNHKVRKITPTGKVTTIAGTLWNTDNSGNQIGTGTNARFRFPTGIFYDIEGGFLLIADTDNHQLKKVQLSGFEVLPPLPTGLSFNTSTGVISGTPTAVSLQNVYQNNFNTSQLQFLAGETVTLADNAAVIGDYLQLTPRQNNSKGGITIEPFESNGFGSLKVSFDLITTKSSADNTSADGFSYSFAPDASATATSPQAEIGTGTKLTVSFATFGSNRGIRIFYNPASNQSLGTTLNSVLLAYTNNTSWMGKSVKVVLDVTDMGDLTLTIDGVTIFTTTLPANFSNSDKSTWKHVFKARTGLSNDLHAIDNLSLQLRNGPTRHTVVGRDYNNEVESTFLINSSVLPTVSTQSVTSIQYTQATVNYQILGPGSSSLSNSGFVWSTTPSPTIFDNAVIHPSPAVVGNQSLAFDDLLSSTTYYVRAVVINEWGVYAYGQELSFTTLAYTAPTVSTNGTTAVTQTTAVSGGDVTNDGGNTLVERGICWSTNPNPTIADQKIVDSVPSVGTFTSSITGLVAGTVYYIKAYATNSVGTTYGSEQSFMTIPTIPVITYPEENYLAQNFPTAGVVPTITAGIVTQGLSGVSTVAHSFGPSNPEHFAVSHDNNFFYYPLNNAIYKINRATNVTTILAGGTFGSTDGIGAAAQFVFTANAGIAVNKTTGNIYVISDANQSTARLRQITPDGVVTTIPNIIDDSLEYPSGPIAVDGLGNIFYLNNIKAIGKIPCMNNSGTPTFGTPIPNWAGNKFIQNNLDGVGSAARFRQITSSIAIDASNNLYVVDLRLIRKISPTAVVTTIAGNLNSTSNSNGLSIDGIGTSAYFTNYGSYTYSPLDNSLYGIDMGSSQFIRKIDLATLNVTTLYQTNPTSGAGMIREMLNGDLYGVLSVGVKSISKTTVFGYSVAPSLPAGLSITATGEIAGTPTVLSPLTTYTIKSINPYHIVNATTKIVVEPFITSSPITSYQTFCSGALVSDLLATGTYLQWYAALTGGIAIPTAAALATGTYYLEQIIVASVVDIGSDFNFPSGVAIQADGKIVIVDSGNNTIKRMNADGSNIETLGSGFSSPKDVVIQADGKIVIVDTGNDAIKRMNADGTNIETLGTGFASPYGVAIQGDGKIVVADSNNNAIKRMNADGTNVETLGSGFSNPTGVAIQADGKIVVADAANNAIKRMNADGTNIETLGSGFSLPTRIAIQADGKIVVADADNIAIKRMNVDGSNIETLGNGFSFPYAVAIQSDGKIVVVDLLVHTIKRITEASSNRVPVNVTVNNTEAPTASAQSFSTNETVSDLVATGTALQWYAASTGGTALPTTTALSSGMYYVSQTLNSCESPRTAVAVTVDVMTAPTAFAQTVCNGATVANLVATGTDLKWYATATGGSVLVTTTALSSGTYYVSQTLSGNESARTSVLVTVLSNVGSISGIFGTSNLLFSTSTATYSINPVNGATSYVWDLPAGMTLESQTGPSITVTLSATYTDGTLRVKAVNPCNESPTRTLRVRRATPIAPGGFALALSGEPVLCANATQVYTATTINNGVYLWTVPANVSIVSGQGTSSITVASTSDFASGQIRVSCSTATATQLASINVSGAPLPSAIVGPSTLCSLTQANYSVTNVAGLTYQWTVPSGMTITSGQGTSSISVAVSNDVSGLVSVQAISACGMSASVRLTVGTTAVLGGISGTAIVCGPAQTTIGANGQVLNNNPLSQYTYAVTAVAGVTNYNWTVPTGATLVSGQGTNAIVVSFDLSNFGTGNISVQGSNSCGTGIIRTLAVSTITGNIAGPTNLCSLTTASYSVPSDIGTNFVWSLPTGMTITSGADTSSITVAIVHPINFANANQVSVSFTTACGGTRTFTTAVDCGDYTNLRPDNCGATLNATTSLIYATPRTGASAYDFEVTYDGTVYPTVTRTTSNFRLSEVTGLPLVFDAEYSIRVRFTRNGQTGIYGQSCTVNTPSIPTTTLRNDSCGATLSATTSLIYAASVVGASTYEFEVTYNGTIYPIFTSNIGQFRLSQIAGLPLVFGGTYSVRVRILSNGQTGSYGASCQVNTPNIPTTTIHAQSCGTTLSATTSLIYATSIVGATSYEFEVTYNGTVYPTFVSNTSSFRLSQVAGLPLLFGSQYSIRVRILSNGQAGTYSSSCIVITPSIPTTSLVTTQCDQYPVTSNSEQIVAQPLTGVTVYRFRIFNNVDYTYTYDSTTNHFTLNNFPGLVSGAAYFVAVAVKFANEPDFGPYSKECSIVAPTDETRSTAKDTKLKGYVVNPFQAVAYPNPFASNFKLDITTSSEANLHVKVYDMTGKLVEDKMINASEIQNFELGNQYSAGVYNIIVSQEAETKTVRVIKR